MAKSFNVGRLVVSAALDLSKLNAGLAKSRTALEKWGKNLKSLGMTMTKRLTAPMALVGAGAVKMAGDFEKAMVQSTAIMGNLSDTMRNEMEKAARDIAKVSTFSAKEAAQAFYFLASAGLSAKQSISALPGIVNFATAGQFDLSRATTLAANAQSALGLSTDDAAQNYKNLVRVTDVLVKANTLADASVEQFAEALVGKAGPAIKNVGMSIEEGVAALAVLAKQGIKGAEASTKLGTAIDELQSKAVINADAFKDYRIAVFDSNGEMRNLGDIAEDLEKQLGTLSDEAKTAAFEQLGLGVKTRSTILSFVGFSDTLRDWQGVMEDAQGTTQEVTDKQLKNLNDQLKILWHNIADVAIGLGKALLPAVKKLIGIVRDIVEWFDKLSPSIKTVGAVAAAAAAALGPLLLVVSQLLFFLPSLGAAAAALGTTMMALATSPMTLAVASMAAFAAALYALLTPTALATEKTATFTTKLEELEDQARKTKEAVESAYGERSALEKEIQGHEARLKRLQDKFAKFSQNLQKTMPDDDYGIQIAPGEWTWGNPAQIKKEIDALDKLIGTLKQHAMRVAESNIANAEHKASIDAVAAADERRRTALEDVSKRYGVNKDELAKLNEELAVWQKFQQEIVRHVEEGDPALQQSGQRIQDLKTAITELSQAEVAAVQPTQEIIYNLAGIDVAAIKAAHGLDALAEKVQFWEAAVEKIRAIREQMQGFADQDMANALVMLTEWGESLQLQMTDLATVLTDIFDQFVSGFANAVANAIVYGEDFGEAMKAVGQDILANMIQMLITLGLEQLAYSILSIATVTEKAAAEMAAAAMTTYANAYAAAVGPLTALLLFGGPAAAAGLAAGAVATMLAGAATAAGGGKAAAMAGITGLAEGGLVMQPTLALVGEAGPEAVVPLTDAKKLLGRGDVVTILEADGRTLAKIVAPHLSGVIKKRIGGRMV